MKTRVILILIAICLLVAALPVSAAVLTGGIASVAEESTMIKGAVVGSTVRFSATDFKQAMGITRFEGITVTALPGEEEGTLCFGGQPLTAPVTVPRASLDSLTFVPRNEEIREAAFRFTCDSYAGGAEITCAIRFAEELNRGPTVSDVVASRAVSTFAGTLAEGTLCATDPEGDAIEFIVIGYPKHGTLTMVDAALGEYRYTPAAGYIGSDEFTFVVRDIYGNYSTPATVAVTVEAAEDITCYRDLIGSAVSLPAIALERENIMLGTLVGDGMYFSPDEELTRGEFLVMAMKAAGYAPRAGLSHTVFDDDAEIPEGIRPYVATAQEAGFILGKLSDEGLVFAAEETVTRGEAALVLATLLGAEVPTGATPLTDEDIPRRVRVAAEALVLRGIYPRNTEGLLATDAPLDRAAAAEMLYATLLDRG